MLYQTLVLSVNETKSLCFTLLRLYVRARESISVVSIFLESIVSLVSSNMRAQCPLNHSSRSPTCDKRKLRREDDRQRRRVCNSLGMYSAPCQEHR